MLLYEELRRGPLEAKVRRVKGQYNSFSLSPKFKNPLFWQRPTKVHFFLHKVDVESSWGFLPQLACLHSHPLSDEGGIKCILLHTLYCFLHLLRKEIIPFAQLAWRALVSETVWFGGSDLQGHSPLHAVFWFPVGCMVYLGCKYNVLLQTNASVWKLTLPEVDGAVLLWVLSPCPVGGWTEPAGINLNEMWAMDLSSPTNVPNLSWNLSNKRKNYFFWLKLHLRWP